MEKAFTVLGSFSKLEDPRTGNAKLHKLIDIIVIIICGVICGADDSVSIEAYGKEKYAWLRKYLELSNGIPSHDTISRVMSLLKPKELRKCFADWIKGISQITKGEVIAIDGKALKRSYPKGDKNAMVHMVSAWASSNGVVLGQEKVDKKSNEIKAIPKLLEMIEIKGCIVTIDAMGCQREIVSKIKEGKGDYVLALKGNQGNLYEDVKTYFEWAIANDFKDISYRYCETLDGDHGRIETRRYWITGDVNWIIDKEKWEGLNSIGCVESIREIDGKMTVETRYYINSIEADSKEFSRAVRSHWTIENSLHWVLDVVFREDDSRIRSGYGAENFSVARHIALNLLKQEKTVKIGVKNKRLKAGWSDSYMEKIILC
jgi:predicted transposase YbfD/YdcC